MTFDQLTATPQPSAYRLPAEWEPHAATWLAWPHRRATWLGPFEPVPTVYEQLARLIDRKSTRLNSSH